MVVSLELVVVPVESPDGVEGDDDCVVPDELLVEEDVDEDVLLSDAWHIAMRIGLHRGKYSFSISANVGFVCCHVPDSLDISKRNPVPPNSLASP